jgi:hypothetical protein
VRHKVYGELGLSFDTPDEKRVPIYTATPPYSLIGDECLDVSSQEELAVVCRSVKEGKAVERFITIIPLASKTAQQIYGSLMIHCDDFKLPFERLVAIGSDGSSNWSGNQNGVWEKYKADQPCGLGIHCNNHKTNLAACKAADTVRPVKHFCDQIESLHFLFKSSGPRTHHLHDIQVLLEADILSVTRAAATRWLSREEVCVKLLRMMGPLFCYLIEDSYNPNAADKAKVSAMAHGLRSWQFIHTLCLMCDVLPIIGRWSKLLQTPGQDWCTIYKELPDFKAQLVALKENRGQNLRYVETLMREVEEEVRKFGSVRKEEWADWDGESGTRPRKWGTIQFELTNFAFDRPTADDRKDWDQRTHRAYVQALLDYLDTYFPPNPVLESLNRSSFSVSTVLNLCTRRLFSVDPLPRFAEDIGDDLKRVFEHYKALLHEKDLRALKQEYDSYLVFARTRQQLAPRERLQQWLTSEFGKTFYNISLLMMVFLALPVSSAEAERVFSTMKRIKTDNRNRLGAQVLDDLMMISCNSPAPNEFNYDEAVFRWYVADTRRVKLGDGFLAYLMHKFPWVKVHSR